MNRISEIGTCFRRFLLGFVRSTIFDLDLVDSLEHFQVNDSIELNCDKFTGNKFIMNLVYYVVLSLESTVRCRKLNR